MNVVGSLVGLIVSSVTVSICGNVAPSKKLTDGEDT
jgi:hypothetical protein